MRNDSDADFDSECPLWLTFGLFHNTTEKAWFRGVPRVWYQALDFDQHDPAPAAREIPERRVNMGGVEGPWRYQMQQHFRARKICGPGRVCVTFCIDQSTEEERSQNEREVKKAVEALVERKKQLERKVKGLGEEWRTRSN